MLLTGVGALFGSSSTTLPLDAIGASAAGAYGLRKLRAAYAGNCIKVTTSAAGNATQDIGFTGNDLDTASLSSFLGSNTGTVTTWYDQSGNTRDFTQATLANQPTIYTSSAVVAQINSKPTMQFDGTNDQLTRATATTTLTPNGSAFTFFSVWRPTAFPTAGNANDLGGVGDNNNGLMVGYDNTPRVADGSNASIAGAISVGSAPFSDMIMIRSAALTSGTAQTLYRNGSGSTSTVNWGGSFTDGETITIGSSFRPHWFTGHMASIYFFVSQLSQADSNGLAGNEAAYYGLTWTNI